MVSLRARVYCLKRLLARGVIEGGVFKKENIPLYLMDSFSLQVDVPKNKDVISIE